MAFPRISNGLQVMVEIDGELVRKQLVVTDSDGSILGSINVQEIDIHLGFGDVSDFSMRGCFTVGEG